jgi:multiple sugar transport system ATP-binding protein
MNFIPCQLDEIDGVAAVKLNNGIDDQVVKLGNITQDQRAFVGKSIILGVRPEQLTDPASAHNDTPNMQTVTGTITITEPTGPDTLVTVTMNGVKTVARCHPRTAGVPGRSVQLSLDTSKSLLFDPVSEKRLA